MSRESRGRKFNSRQDGLDTRQMMFVTKLLNQPQSRFSKVGGTPEPMPQEESVSKQIMATQLKLDPVALIPNNVTMSSKNSDLEQTLIPAASGGAASHHMPFEPAYMPNSPVAVATILEEDTSTIHKQSQEFKLELNKSFRNILVAPPKQLFETDIFKTRQQKFQFPEASPFSPTIFTQNQKQILYNTNLEQLGAMTIRKYQLKPKLKALVSDNWYCMGESEGTSIGAMDVGHYNIRDLEPPATRKFEPVRHNPTGPRQHTPTQYQLPGSPGRARVPNPIRITSITKSHFQRELIDEKQQFLNNLLAPGRLSKAEGSHQAQYTSTQLKGTLVKNEIEAARYSPVLQVTRNDSNLKDDSEDGSRKILRQTLDGVVDEGIIQQDLKDQTRTVQRNQQNGTTTSFREIASNYTLNMESTHPEAEKKRESTKASQALPNPLERSSETGEDEMTLHNKKLRSRQRNQIQKTLSTNQAYYQTMRFPKIKTVYVPLGQAPPKTPRDFPAGKRAVGAGRMPARLTFQAGKSGQQRWKTPVVHNIANDTTDGSTTLRSSHKSSLINKFDSVHQQANQAIMQFPKSYRRSQDAQPCRNTQQPSKERKYKHQKIPSFNFNFGVEANHTQNIGNFMATYDDLAHNAARSIQARQNSEDKKQLYVSNVGASQRQSELKVARLPVSQYNQTQIVNQNVKQRMDQLDDKEARGILTGVGSPGGIMSPVSFMGSRQDLGVKQKSKEALESERPGSADAEDTRSLGRQGSASLKAIQNNEQNASQADDDRKTPTHSTAAAQTPDLQRFPPGSLGMGQYSAVGSSSSPRGTHHSSNFYLDIEKQPFLTLDYELQAQQQIRDIQKQIRIKKEIVKKQIRENGHQLVIMEENLELKQKLSKIAQQIDTQKKSINQEKSDTRAEQINIQGEDNQEHGEGSLNQQAPTLTSDPGRKDESQQVDFGAKRQVKAILTERLLDGSNDISIDDQNPESLKQTFDLKIMRKQMLPQSAIFKGMSSGSQPQYQKRSPFKNSHSSSLQPEERKKVPDAAELQMIKMNNLKIEQRIAKLYKTQVCSDLSRDKQKAEESIKILRNRAQLNAEDAEELRIQNRKLAGTIKKYKNYIDNFDAKEEESQEQLTSEKFDSFDFRKTMGIFQSEDRQTEKSRSASRTGAASGRESTIKQFKPAKTPGRQSSQQSHYVSKTVDAGKLGKLVYHTRAACKRVERPLDFVLNLLENVKLYLQCPKAMFVPVDPLLAQVLTGHGKRKGLDQKTQNILHEVDYVDQLSQESKKLIAICQDKEELGDIIFPSISDPEASPIETLDGKAAMLFRFCRPGAPVSFIIQTQFDKSTKKAQGQAHGKKDKSKAQPDKKYNKTELVALRGVCQCVQLKLENIMHVHQKRLMANEQQHSIALIKHMTKCTTLRGLMREMNNNLMSFLGFSDINLLFHDNENAQLYTITFGDEEEKKSRFAALLKKAKTEKEREDIRDEESMQDVVLNAQQMIFYPTHLGISSKSFHQQKTFVINDFQNNPKKAEFVSAIDNPRGVKAIRNYMVGVLQREDKSTNGLVQLFNSSRPISTYDRRRLESMGKFFGGCIENIESKTKKLTTMLAIEGNGPPASAAVEAGCAAVVDEGTFTDLGKALGCVDTELVHDQEMINEMNEI